MCLRCQSLASSQRDLDEAGDGNQVEDENETPGQDQVSRCGPASQQKNNEKKKNR